MRPFESLDAEEKVSERPRWRPGPSSVLTRFSGGSTSKEDGPSLPLPPLSHLTPARRERGGFLRTNLKLSPSSPGRVGVRRERRVGEVRGLTLDSRIPERQDSSGHAHD